MSKIVISDRAYRLMQVELSKYPEVETGGVLLGYPEDESGRIHVVEATDGGWRAMHEEGCFSYDEVYVQHIAELIAALYQPPLTFLGVWHKHNHNYEPPFSEEDERIHEKMLDIVGTEAVSILFQKIEKEQYQMGAFLLRKPDICEEVDFVLE